jgi:death-on-curing protein
VRPPVFLSVDHVLEIHERMIAEFGGDAAVRDRGLLESAVAMPSARFGGEFLHATRAEMAAAYLFHLCKNHPFVDGNKRTALASAEMFLLLNGYTLTAPDTELGDIVVAVADGSMGKSELTAVFRTLVRRDKR